MIKAIYNNFSPFKLNKFYMKSISIQILGKCFWKSNELQCLVTIYSTDLLLLNVSKILLS